MMYRGVVLMHLNYLVVRFVAMGVIVAANYVALNAWAFFRPGSDGYDTGTCRLSR
jgi:hypothetical protein